MSVPTARPLAISVRTWKLYKQSMAADDLRTLLEDQWQAWCEVQAWSAGWARQFHVRRAQVKGRWLTNTSSPGVPDLWLVNPIQGRMLVLECKAQDGRPSVEQLEWIADLQTVPGIDAVIVRPSDAIALLKLLAPPPRS